MQLNFTAKINVGRKFGTSAGVHLIEGPPNNTGLVSL